MINPEQIAASDAFLFISSLPPVCNDLSRKKTDTPDHKSVVYHYHPTHTPGSYPEQAEGPRGPLGQLWEVRGKVVRLKARLRDLLAL